MAFSALLSSAFIDRKVMAAREACLQEQAAEGYQQYASERYVDRDGATHDLQAPPSAPRDAGQDDGSGR